MLAVSLLANTSKAMTLYHTLETLSFGGAYNGHLVALGKDVNTNGVANIFISFAIAYFFYYFFCRSVCSGVSRRIYIADRIR